MLYLKREQNQDPWSSFSKPFENDVWVAVMLYIGLSGLIRYILYIFLYNFKETKTGLYNSLLQSLQIFCNQGKRETFLPFFLKFFFNISALHEKFLADVMDAIECDIVEVPKRILVFYIGMIMDEKLPCRNHLSTG